MKRKTLFFSVASIILLVLTVINYYMWSNPRQFPHGLALWAERLSAKPENYIVVTDPDAYLLEALSNPKTEVCVGDWKNTNFVELVDAHGTNNVEFGDAYYTVHMLSVEPGWIWLFWIVLVGWIVLGVLGVGFLISHLTARRA